MKTKAASEPTRNVAEASVAENNVDSFNIEDGDLDLEFDIKNLILDENIENEVNLDEDLLSED
ncbi:hypothetical protein X975_07930, partial [Stegodyphus mimosarum]